MLPHCSRNLGDTGANRTDTGANRSTPYVNLSMQVGIISDKSKTAPTCNSANPRKVGEISFQTSYAGSIPVARSTEPPGNGRFLCLLTGPDTGLSTGC